MIYKSGIENIYLCTSLRGRVKKENGYFIISEYREMVCNLRIVSPNSTLFLYFPISCSEVFQTLAQKIN